MRILTVTNLYRPDLIGGYEIACGQMVDHLRARGHEVSVLTTMPRQAVPPEAGVTRALRLTDWHTRLHRESTVAEVDRVMDVQGKAVDSSNVGELLRAVDAFRPDVVYLWNTAFVGGLGLVGALAHLQLPVVWHLMDDAPRSMVTVGGQTVSAAARLVSRRMRARYLLCSQRLLEEIATAGYEFGDRAAVIPNWVDPTPARARKFYPDAGPLLRIVAAGQLAPHKGFGQIMEAARRLLDSGRSGFTIDIFGGGMDDYYQCLILDFGLQDHVHLRGSLPQSDLIARFWDYDIFLFPTWSREPFGFAPLEAASCGCVPIISRECGIAEWCVDGVHAIKVAPEAEALAETVGRILDEKTDLVSIARRARWAISTGFSLQRVGDYVERAFDEVRHSEAVRPGRPEDAYNLGRLAERLALDWAARPQNLGV